MSDILMVKKAIPSTPDSTRVKLFFDVGGNLSSVDELGNVKTYAEGITVEEVQDIVGAMFGASASVVPTYDDSGNIISLEVDQAGIDHTQILNRGTNTHAQIDAHLASVSNPHNTTKAQVGLANVPNVDATNPANITQSATFRFVTDAEKTTWNSKENAIASGTTSQYWRGDKTFQDLNKAAVGLGNVDNTSDLNKPISTATQTALNLKYDASNPNGYETPTQLNVRDTNNRNRINHTGTQTASTISDFTTSVDSRITSQKGVANGIATLDATTKIPVIQIPSLPYAPTSHTHTASEITDFTTAVETVGDARYSLLGHTHPDATTTTSGFMSPTDKVKLDGLTSDVVLRSTTQYNNTSNVTYVTCPQLAVNCVAGRLYYVKWMLRNTAAAAATGFRHGLGGTAVGTVNFTGTVLGSTTGSTGAQWQANLIAFNTNTQVTSSTGTSASIAVLEGIFICTTGGTIYPQFLSETNGTQVSLLANSICVYKEIL